MRKKKLTTLALCFVMAILLFPITASADTGPKPSVRITFENMGDETCYGTLLSRDPSYGPHNVWDGTPENILDKGQNAVWQAFVDYKDADGYYFQQEFWLCSEDKQLNWTYYPPYSFKILLYYPQLDTYAVSGVYERYAFDSYYTVDMAGVDIHAENAVITARQSYHYAWELVSLVCRVTLTILLELAVAKLFSLWQRDILRVILWVNVVTQFGLNIVLNLINYSYGAFAFVGYYFLLECAVFVIEAIAYLFWLRKQRGRQFTAMQIILYALVANIVSFISGMGVAAIIPGIF